MNQHAHKENQDAEFSWPVRVYYEDTDAGGVVFYANYLKFFERARTEWLRSIDVHQHDLVHLEKVVFVVKSSSIDYHAPARLDDELSITVLIEKLGRASVQFLQQAWRVNGNVPLLLTTARVTVACVENTSFRPCPIPTGVLQKITARP
jgi:acyl-CoA thioester hydrolase